jgi:hypothetical protein
MTGLNEITTAQPHAAFAAVTRHLTHHSSMRENVFEHMLLGQLGAELLARGVEYDELHSSVDKDGFDVLLEAGGILRHTQLKVKIDGGARGDVTVNTRLAARPSGCVVWLTFDPVERCFCDIRWFGGAPGQRLPDTGGKVARHTRANSKGVKTNRPEHRVLPVSRFERLDDIAHLADRLFGRQPAEPLAFLRSRLRLRDGNKPDWLPAVAAGQFSAIPADISWQRGANELACLINGYHMLELISSEHPATFLGRQQQVWQETGHYAGDAVALWTTLFLEARADHFGSNDFATSYERQDKLALQLRHALVELENSHA